MRGQVLTIALVVAAGIAAFVGVRCTYLSLLESKEAYYERYRFADVFAHLERAPDTVGEELLAIDGVARVQTRIVDAVRLPMEDMLEPATGQIVSLPEHGEPVLNAVHIKSGRMVEAGRSDEVVVLEAFAEAHGLEPGDHLPVVMNGKLRRLRIVGTGMSPEFVFAMPPGEMAPDSARYTILWMSHDAVAAAFDLSGAFNDVTLKLEPGASESDVMTRLDAVLERWGGAGSVPRSHQLSNYGLEQEMGGLRSMANTAPAIFLFVAAFLLNVVLSRLIALSRPEIAALKALGYADRRIGLYYLELVSLIVLMGALLGLAFGNLIGGAFTQMYTQYFRFPDLRFRLDNGVYGVAVAVSLISGVVGALGAVRRVVRLPPAEAMRPPPPADYRRSFFERSALFAMLGQATRMILREVRRRPLRFSVSVLGIALSVGIVVVGRFFADSMNYLIDEYMQSAWREDVAVGFLEPVSMRELHSLEGEPGVFRAEPFRIVPARISFGPRHRDSAVMGYSAGSVLRQPIDRDTNVVPLPAEGILLTRKLGEVLGVSIGERVRVEVHEGDRPTLAIPVAGFVSELAGLQGHMRLGALDRLLHEQDTASMALLSIDPARYDELLRRLQDMPGVVSINRKAVTVERFRRQSGEMNHIFAAVLAFFAAIIAIGVVYNNARISLSMRSRDLASLRVLGFTRAEISRVLLGELALQVVCAIPIGLWIGRKMGEGIMSFYDAEMYRLPVIVSGSTYAFATLVVTAAALVSALMVRQKLDHLDLIGVLKTRE